MFALVDCNNFYVSCERLFRPDLKGRPVVVLSNNDGCAVSRSQEAKDLGVQMGQPWFQLQDLVRRHGLVAFSSNYTLYADLSDRVMSVLRDMAPRIEVYSIDESFLDLTGIRDREALSRQLRIRVLRWVGIPVCVGIGSTKTRAKLANHIAKKNPSLSGVFDLEALGLEEQAAWLSRIKVGEVWGVGRKISRRLESAGVLTVADLQACDTESIRQQFSVTMARTVAELNGVSCLDMEEVAPAKQQIMVSRSFGRPVLTLEELQQPVVTHAARAGEKLREEGSVSQAVMVFARTDPFRSNLPQYSASRIVPLVTPTQDSRLIIEAAVAGLKHLYRPGYFYKKAGVMLCDLSPAGVDQADLFSRGDDERAGRLMSTIDALNQRMGRGAIFFAGQGVQRRWIAQSNLMSGAYTTRWGQLQVVHA